MPETAPQKPLIDKLGVKPGQHIIVLGIDDEAFLASVEQRSGEHTCSPGTEEGGCDIIFLGIEDEEDLTWLKRVQGHLKPSGAIWAIFHKGRTEGITASDVRAAGLECGLVDIKVVSFSATHTGLMFVVPIAER